MFLRNRFQSLFSLCYWRFGPIFFFNMVQYCNYYYEKMLCYIYGVLFVPFLNVLTVIVLYSKMFLCIENVNSLEIKLEQIESR